MPSDAPGSALSAVELPIQEATLELIRSFIPILLRLPRLHRHGLGERLAILEPLRGLIQRIDLRRYEHASYYVALRVVCLPPGAAGTSIPQPIRSRKILHRSWLPPEGSSSTRPESTADRSSSARLCLCRSAPYLQLRLAGSRRHPLSQHFRPGAHQP
jgi:hypothetical protein